MMMRLLRSKIVFPTVRWYYNKISAKNDEMVIDFRSDTVTKPSPGMYERMLNSPLGDDVYKEDPTVNELEKQCSDLFGMENALFTPSGTMGNLLCVMSHCDKRSEGLIIGDKQHVYIYEQGHFMQLAGIPASVVPNMSDGTICLHRLESLVDDGSDFHSCKTKLICLENTFNGIPLSIEYLDQVSQVAKKHNLKLHVDGARIYNAAIALKCEVKDLLKHVDSVSMCLSKGLGCPVGSVIGGNADFINSAKFTRKALGGGLRQSGILAAAGLYALDNAKATLSRDHNNAQTLAHGLSNISKNTIVEIDPKEVYTNMVFLKTKGDIAGDLSRKLWDNGILQFPYTPSTIRLVLHLNISEADVHRALDIITKVIKEF